MSNKLKTFLKSLAFFSIGFLALFLVFRSQNKNYQEECALKGIAAENCSLLEKVFTDFSGANYWVLGIVLLCFMISNVSRALRWQLLLEPVSHKPRFVNSIGAIMAAYLTNLGIPRSGEFVRAGILGKYENIPAEKVMGTIVTDRVLDVLCLLIAIGLAFFISFDDMFGYFKNNQAFQERWTQLSGNTPILVVLALSGVAFLSLLYYFRKTILASKLGQKVFTLVKGFAEGLQSVFKLRSPGWFFFHTAVIWVMYFLMTYIGFFAFEATSHLGASAGLVVFVFGTLGIVFPAPGGMGSYHWLVSEGLALYGINGADAFSFANLLFFTVAIFCNVFFGLVAFIILPIFNSNNE